MSKLVGLSMIAAFASACVTNTPPNPNEPDGGNVTVIPKVGVWAYDTVTPVSNDCNSAIREDAPGNFGILAASATTFHVDPNDGNPTFDCSLSSGSFSCPNRIAATQDFRPAIDAVATVRVDANGSFSATTRGSGSQTATVDCVGTACAAHGPWPCHFKQNFVIIAQ